MYGRDDYKFDAEARGDCPLCGRDDCAHCEVCGQLAIGGKCECTEQEKSDDDTSK